MAQRGGKRPGAGRKPGIVSEAKKSIAEAAKGYGEKMLDVLATVANDDSAPPAARVSAANAILDRGYGKPTASLDVSSRGESLVPVVVRVVSSEIEPGPASEEDYET